MITANAVVPSKAEKSFPGTYINIQKSQETIRCTSALIANKQVAKKLTTPKLTKHNDAAYYPNIQCLLCREWVCSRNR